MVEPRKTPRHPPTTVPSHEAPDTGSTANAEQKLIVTLNAATHEIVNIERLDVAGRRQQLSEADCAALAGDDDVEDLVGAAQEAYEAGVTEGLDAEDEQDAADDDIVLWQLLARTSAARRAFSGSIRGALLRRVLLRRMLRHRLAHPAVA